MEFLAFKMPFGDVFGQLVEVGEGIVLAIPPVNEKLRLIGAFLERLSMAKTVTRREDSSENVPAAAEQSLPTSDVFISYASEDKSDIARPLAELLQKGGITVWYDDYELKLGDSLRQKIDEGLRISRFGVTILSHNFFAKRWPVEELNALYALGTRILPIWHNLTAEDVKQYSPLLADRFAAKTSEGLQAVTRKIVEVVKG